MNPQSLLLRACNSVFPSLVPPRLSCFDCVWTKDNFKKLFFERSKKPWEIGFSLNPISSSEQLDSKLLQSFDHFLGRKHEPFQLNLEYSLGGFFVNSEFFVRKNSLALLCCEKLVPLDSIDKASLSNWVHGPDYDVLAFILFFSKLPFKVVFSLFYDYGTVTEEQSTLHYKIISYRKFIEIFSDVNVMLDAELVKINA